MRRGWAGAGTSAAAAAERSLPMRVQAKPLDRYPWYLRPFFWNQRRKYGAVLDPALLWARSPALFATVALLWARSPALFATVALLYGALDRRSSPIEPPLRSLITVRVSQINWCRFCVDINTATLLRRGVPLAKVEALAGWRTSPLFDDRERAALDYAEKMTERAPGVDHALMDRLRRHFDDDAIVELTGLIAFQNLSSRFNAALDVPAQGFCTIPALPAQDHADLAASLQDRDFDI